MNTVNILPHPPFNTCQHLPSPNRTQEEMAHTCRGTINLAGAFIDTIDATRFVITNGPSQVYHLKVLNEVERQRWVTALELAKARAIKTLESGELPAGFPMKPDLEKLKSYRLELSLYASSYSQFDCGCC